MKSTSFGYYLSYYKNYFQYRKNKIEYYKQFLQFEDLNSISQLLEKKKTVETTSPIQFYNLIAGENISEVTKKLGSPVIILKQPTFSSLHSIYCFKKKVSALSLLVYCHFWDGQLFMVQNCYPNSRKFTWNSVLELLHRKYNVGGKTNNNYSIVIESSYDGKLIVENDVDLNLFYISDTSFLTSIISSVNSRREKTKKLSQEKVLSLLEPFV